MREGGVVVTTFTYRWMDCSNGTLHLGRYEGATWKGWVKQSSEEAKQAPPKPRNVYCRLCGDIAVIAGLCDECAQGVFLEP